MVRLVAGRAGTRQPARRDYLSVTPQVRRRSRQRRGARSGPALVAGPDEGLPFGVVAARPRAAAPGSKNDKNRTRTIDAKTAAISRGSVAEVLTASCKAHQISVKAASPCAGGKRGTRGRQGRADGPGVARHQRRRGHAGAEHLRAAQGAGRPAAHRDRPQVRLPVRRADARAARRAADGRARRPAAREPERRRGPGILQRRAHRSRRRLSARAGLNPGTRSPTTGTART